MDQADNSQELEVKKHSTSVEEQALKDKSIEFNESGVEDFKNLNFETALDKMNKAIKLFPSNSNFYNNAACCLWGLNRQPEALEMMKAGLQHNN